METTIKLSQQQKELLQEILFDEIQRTKCKSDLSGYGGTVVRSLEDIRKQLGD